jgi:hypothetical protein
MAWVRIDCTHQRHPKVVQAGPMAELLDLRAIAYSAEMELDGRVPSAALGQIGRGIPRVKVAVNRLVKAGRWREASRRDGGDGWVIHDFLENQPSKAEREADRAAARTRQRAFRARNNGVTDTARHAVSHAAQDDTTRTKNKLSAERRKAQPVDKDEHERQMAAARSTLAETVRPPSRTAVRTVTCPACGAEPHKVCIGARRERVANHMERVDRYLETQARDVG